MLQSEGRSNGGNEPLRRGTVGVRLREQRRDDIVFFPVGHPVIVSVLPTVGGVQRVQGPSIIKKVPTGKPNLPAIGHTIVVCIGVERVCCTHAVGRKSGSDRTRGSVGERIVWGALVADVVKETGVEAGGKFNPVKGLIPVEQVRANVIFEVVHKGFILRKNAVSVDVIAITVGVFERI